MRSNPGVGDIFGVGFPDPGINVDTTTAGGRLNMGITDGRSLGGFKWEPTGDDFFNPAALLDYGRAKKKNANSSLRSHDFVQYTYPSVEWADGSEEYIMPEMQMFSVRTSPGMDNGYTPVTLIKANQLLYDAQKIFNDACNEGDPQALEYRVALRKFGENSLYCFHTARHHPTYAEAMKKRLGDNYGEMTKFYLTSFEDVYCYLTVFGVLHKLNYTGPVININRAIGVEGYDKTQQEDHNTIVNNGYAKRLAVANIFGDNDDVTTGSTVGLTLTRKQIVDRDGAVRYGYLQIIPHGSKLREKALRGCETSFIDESGRNVPGYSWTIGVVLTPCASATTDTQRQNAANCGPTVSERRAYEAHGTIPQMFVLVGFKH